MSRLFLPSVSDLDDLSRPEKRMSKAECDLSFVIPAKNAEHSIEKTIAAVVTFLETKFPELTSEILIVPTYSDQDPTLKILERYKDLPPNPHQTLKVVTHYRPIGKGAALQTGILASRGRFIFTTDADLPYDLSFFVQAKTLLENDFHLITGNRRSPESLFDLPVSLLGLAYKRHRLGLVFNRLVRGVFGLNTTDTQAGIKAFSRTLAVTVFEHLRCPGFLYDLELFLLAKQHSLKTVELPVRLKLNTEKTTVRVIKESIIALVWLGKLWRMKAKKSS